MRLGNLDMALLIGYILREAWQGDLNVITAVSDPDQAEPARTFLEQVMDLARLPKARVAVLTGDWKAEIARFPTADLDIFGLAGDPDFELSRRLLRITGSSCLFVRDSDEENVLA